MSLKDWVKKRNETHQKQLDEERLRAELEAVKPHLLHDLDEQDRLLYFRMLMILLHEYPAIFTDEKQGVWALRKWSHSMGFDENAQQDVMQEVSLYDDESQQEMLETFAQDAEPDVACCLFCDFVRLRGEKYTLENEIVEFIKSLAADDFKLSDDATQALAMLCGKIASGEALASDDKIADISAEVIDYYFGQTVPATQATYLVIDLSGGNNAPSYPIRYVDTEPDLSSDTCRTTELWLKRLSKGSFLMGDGNDAHDVELTQDYYVGVFPVTQRQWELVIGSNPSQFTNVGPGAPVERVSYIDICGKDRPWPENDSVSAYSFLGKLRAKTGLATIDLPTEAQWEYACRAGTMSLYSFGQDCNSSLCNFNNAVGHTTVVGQYPPNPWGLYDMHGNVWEWCRDWFGDYSGNESDPEGATTGSDRVYRGGSWFGSAKGCRSTCRSGGSVPGDRGCHLGLRLVFLPVPEVAPFLWTENQDL